MNCPKCGKNYKIKSGIKYNRQRYKCKSCGCFYTRSTLRGASVETKLFALKLYLEGMGFRGIARTLNVNNTTVLRWIKSIGLSVKTYINMNLPENPRHVDFIEIDEMWHFTLKKNESSGSGLLSIGIPKRSLASLLEAEVEKPTKN